MSEELIFVPCFGGKHKFCIKRLKDGAGRWLIRFREPEVRGIPVLS
jgi:hypothetical protein